MLAPADSDFAQWSELAFNDAERAQVGEVRAAYEAVVRDARGVFDLLDQGRREEATELAKAGLEDGSLAPFEAVTDAAIASDVAYRQVVRGQVRDAQNTAKLVLALAAFGAFSLSLLIAAYLASDLFAPLRELRRAIDAVEAGDLGVRLDGGRRDELGAIQRCFDRMAEALGRRQRTFALVDGIGGDGPAPASVVATADASGDGAAGAAGGPPDWRTLPSRTMLHGLVGQIRARVAALGEQAEAVGPDGSGNGNGRRTEQRTLIAELDQLSLAVERLTDFGFPLDLNLARPDVRALLYEVLLRFHDEFAAHGISFELDISPEVGEATVDRLKLREAIGELVRNGLRALPEQGGRLGLRASTTPDGMELVLEVADNGTGVAEPIMVDAFARRAAGRAGVGLSLTKAIVEQHGGRLDLDSTPGQGTHVVIRLPVRG